MKICPNENCLVGSETATFCRNCGTLLVEAPPDRPPENFPCPSCKASVLPQDKFCGTCGHPVPQKMTEWQKFKLYIYLYFRYDFIEDLRNIRRRIWNKHIKLWWYRLWIRKNEFHPSLSMDVEATFVMDGEELQKYCDDLAERREKAHKRDIAREDVEMEKHQVDR